MGHSAAKPSTVVLIVEDEPLILLAAVQVIEDLGYGVLQATNADEAISLLEAHPEITIVFTDIQMAGSMDGIALSHWAASRWPPLRFIIASGGLSPKAHEMPAAAVFIAKPYKASAIDEAIKGFLAMQSRSQHGSAD